MCWSEQNVLEAFAHVLGAKRLGAYMPHSKGWSKAGLEFVGHEQKVVLRPAGHARYG
ncbi:hypothetical protein BN2475_580005 [Paraburkholderia ribeironis]|uniref:Uncharacterized protein n=1 Tax=Paraburkholderia ribeironis TaxID=1247936 RepID=A0A1N7SE06_9BURK|nr:hypothetical protein BN2475_580005 [Paraburkholderia ribeironis]